MLPLCLSAVRLEAQDSTPLPPSDSMRAIPPQAAPDSVVRVPVERDSLGRPIIRYIWVRGVDIYETSEARKFIPRLMNALHIQTRRGVIERELLFRVGQPYDSARAAETARNLRALGVFRRVKVDSVTTDSGFGVLVLAQDGWSTQADLRFRSTGRQTDWQLSLAEGNLLGTASRFVTRYHHTPDRNTVNFQFIQPRLIARQVALAARYETRSDGKRGDIRIERPFYSISDRAGIQTILDVRNERVVQFRDGFSTPNDSLRRRYFLGRVGAAVALTASERGYLRLGFTGEVRRDDYAAWPTPVGSRSVTGTFGPYLEWRRANYRVTRGFARQGRDEDVDLSNYARVSVLAASSFLGYRRSGVGLLGLARVGTQFAKGFGWIDARANGVFTSAGLDSGSVTLGGTLVLVPFHRHLIVGHADVGSIRNPLPGSEFDLGFSTGPRAFPAHAFTGDRTYFATAEYRYTVGEDIFKALDLGMAAFVDHGGAWYQNEARRTGTDLGIGLRLSPSRAADANTTRLDLGYRLRNDRQKAGWVFSIASGLVFSTLPRQ